MAEKSAASESKSSKVDVARTEVNVEAVIARAEEKVAATSDVLPQMAVPETIVDFSKITPVKSTFASCWASPQDGFDFTTIDLDGQAILAEPTCSPGTCAQTRKFGTAIEWAESVEQAAQLAKEQDKLVFLIQVSGNFAREGFT